MQQASNPGESYLKLHKAVSYDKLGNLRFKTEDGQQIWNDRGRLITNCIIFYNALILSNGLRRQDENEAPRQPDLLHRFLQWLGSTSSSMAVMSLPNRSNRLTSIRLYMNWSPDQALRPQTDSIGIYLFGGICKNTLIGNTMLSSAPYFILGETSNNKDHSSLLTLDFDEAAAFLCISVTYVDIETCYYDEESYIVRSKGDAEIKLVSWPDEQIIAETRYSLTQPEECPSYFISRSDLSNHLVKVNNIDIFDWFSNLNK